VISVITITGIGDHLQPEWLITFTGMRNPRRDVFRLLSRASMQEAFFGEVKSYR
jgi:hypothetical protein